MSWVGVDVGGERKGFDLAVVNRTEVLKLERRLGCSEVTEIVEQVGPLVVAIDSPCCCAPFGEKTRACERALAAGVCGIRWTPDRATVATNDYYGWVVRGLELYDALALFAGQVIEVFPTASWTRWLGARGSQRRSAWTRAGLTELGVDGLPGRTSQDQRDAIAAAVTAREYSDGATQSFGEIVVPKAVV